ncbi:hypothetical protein JGY85_00545 [Shigella sonnei]|nr:hypothetical protein [Shigella sonnei]
MMAFTDLRSAQNCVHPLLILFFDLQGSERPRLTVAGIMLANAGMRTGDFRSLGIRCRSVHARTRTDKTIMPLQTGGSPATHSHLLCGPSCLQKPPHGKEDWSRLPTMRRRSVCSSTSIIFPAQWGTSQRPVTSVTAVRGDLHARRTTGLQLPRIASSAFRCAAASLASGI